MFFNWIYRRTNVQILIILVIFSILYLGLIPRVLQSIPFFSPTEDSTRLGLSLFGSIITLSGLLIGFLLNQAQSNFREVQSLVSQEAGRINNLDRLLTRYGDLAIAHKFVKSYLSTSTQSSTTSGSACKRGMVVQRRICCGAGYLAR